MRRALRHVFTILTPLSLLLCVATCVLWVRSYFVEDHVRYYWRRGSVQTTHLPYELRVLITILDDDLPFVMSAEWKGVPARYFAAPESGSYPWARYHVTRLRPGEAFRIIELPWWVPTTVTALPALMWIIQVSGRGWRGTRSKEHSVCVTCGYDLRASPDRCPECGTAREDDKVTR